MNYMGAELPLEESSLNRDFLNYLRSVETDKTSNFGSNVFGLLVSAGTVVPYFLKRCNTAWNGSRNDFESTSFISPLLEKAFDDEQQGLAVVVKSSAPVHPFRFNARSS